MQLFYNPDLTEEISNVTFNKLESGHIVRVLRKKEGDFLFITNGNGTLFKAEISFSSANKCIADIIDVSSHKKKWPYQLHIAIAPTKSNDRFEWFLEKATEIGIDTITPIICEHSERKVIKLERLEKIIHAASKQSLKYHFPTLNPPIKFSDFITQACEGQKFIAHCEKTDKSFLKDILEPKKSYTILIGPEGDFSKREIEQSLHHEFIPVSLGESRLRTETAGVVATHSASYSNL